MGVAVGAGADAAFPLLSCTTVPPGIRKLLLARPGIDNVQSVQSQWIGPYTFAYKAEVDFDGTYLAAKLMARCVSEGRKRYGDSYVISIELAR